MKQIRKCVFETNSSSTHALSMAKQYLDATEDVFEKTYVIKRFSDNEVDDVMEITTIEDKLRYFLTLYYQTRYYDDEPDGNRNKFMRTLKKIFPNAIFDLDVDYCYVFEDGGYFFNDTEPCCVELLDEAMLKQFMLYGTINFGDRNRESYSDKISRMDRDKNLWTVIWSG